MSLLAGTRLRPQELILVRRWKYGLRLLALLMRPQRGLRAPLFIYHLSAEQLGDMLSREELDYEHTSSSNEPATRRKSAEYPLADTALFAGFAFLITWGTGMVVIFSTDANLVNGAHQVKHPIPLPLPVAISLVMIGTFGPFLAAVVVTGLRSGLAGVRELFGQFGRWRVHPVWFAIALLGPAFLGLVALCATALGGGATPRQWFALPRLVHFAGWSVGPWGEELGWRGYAQPQLQKRLSALGASLVVGTMWSLWHYWPVATPAGGSLMELLQAPFLTGSRTRWPTP